MTPEENLDLQLHELELHHIPIPRGLETTEQFAARMRATGTQTHNVRRTRRVRFLAAAVATSIAALLLATVMPQNSPAMAATPPLLKYEIVPPVELATMPGADARASLLRWAAAARTHGPAPVPTATQRVEFDGWYATIDNTSDTNDTFHTRGITSLLRPDGSTTTTEEFRLTIAPNGHLVADETGTRPPETNESPAGTFDTQLMSTLEESPTTAARTLLMLGGCTESDPAESRTACRFGTINNLSTTRVWTGQALANIWTALAEEPHVKLLGTVTDRLGRPGQAISVIDQHDTPYRHVIIINDTTGTIMGFETILIGAHPDFQVKPPAVVNFTTIVDAHFE